MIDQLAGFTIFMKIDLQEAYRGINGKPLFVVILDILNLQLCLSDEPMHQQHSRA
jgi:hypothetical protein